MDGKVISGNMPEQYIGIAWNVAENGNASGEYFYKVIKRPKEYVVLQYSLTSQYHSAFLREHLIEPQRMMIFLVLFGGMAIIILLSVRFGKNVRIKCSQS